ncbi:MAG TPA: DUF1329 domain-containing protein [Solimonas sp.]|nr:DUF1329 domain-containing protein [Solimonas sp.]
MKRATCMALLALFVAVPALAKVSKEEADKLKTTLMPMGGEKAGNKDGSIPAWEGGLTTSPACYKGPPNRVCDPFADDKPLFTITPANVAKYKDKLPPGQLAMFRKYPDTFKINVYQTRRTAAYPDWIYESTYRNALNGELISNGEGVGGATESIPFPIPKTGVELVWNHKLRYRGPGATRYNEQAAVTTGGDYNLVKLREDVKFIYSTKGIKPEQLNNVSIYFFQVVLQPPRLAGQITLVHETMDQVKEPRRAWQYNPGQRRLRRAPNVGYDNPGTGSDGLRTNDQLDVFNGATDRYTWKVLGKKEMYVPYNSYKIHSNQYKMRDIVRKGHINMDLPRYELHRVWVIEGNVKPSTTHIYARRVFYADEDSWQIVHADLYDRRGELWRVQAAYPLQAYSERIFSAAMETSFDLLSGRYLVFSGNNESPETVTHELDQSYFDPANVQKQATK